MNYDYCGSCGNKIEYLIAKPNFCPFCGVARGGAPGPRPETARRGSVAQAAQEDRGENNFPEDPDGTDINYVPNIGKLEYEVDSDYSGIGSKLVSLGELLGTPPQEQLEQPRPVKKKRGRPRKKKTVDNVVDVGDS